MSQSAVFWLTSAALVAAVLVILFVPFLRRPRKALARAEYDLAIYKDQLRELEEDVAAGLISGEEAAAARNEISRRILAADAAREKAARDLQARGSRASSLAAVVAGLVLVPALAFGIYLEKGRPGMPDMPIAERLERAAQRNDIAALVRRVEARLAEKPDDLEGWLAIAPVYSRMGAYAKAARAWKNIIRLSRTPEAEHYNAYGEALVYANGGRLVPEARAAFARAQKLAPGDPMSRYFLAQAKLQDGKRKEALADLEALLKDLPKSFAGRPLIERQIASLKGRPATTQGQQQGQQEQVSAATTQKPAAPASAADGAGKGDGGPTAQQVRERMKRLQGMSPEARQQMIRNMVEGLEEKLKENPANLDGWLRLIRAWSVLGEKDKAAAALKRAREAFAGKEEALARLNRLAGGLSL